MQLQRERRRDPYPWAWEIPLAIAMLMSLAAVLGVQLGRAVANAVAGAGWTWPSPSTAASAGRSGAVEAPSPLGGQFWASVPDVLAGDAAAGLSRADLSSDGPDRLGGGGDLAGPVLVWLSIGVVELAVLGGLVWALVAAYQRWGPGRMRGMARRDEAEALLGRTRLRRVAAIVRPDLHGKRPAFGRFGAAGRAHIWVHRGASRDPHPGTGRGE